MHLSSPLLSFAAPQGVIYKDRGNLDQAIHFYNLALNANPKFSQTMNNLGVIYTVRAHSGASGACERSCTARCN
jgi:Flp pilus assembly protein TadD